MQLNRTLGLMVGTLACSVLASAADNNPAHSDRGYFISIDGVQPDYIRAYVAATENQAERGFKWITTGSLEADRAFPIVTTLTAASHVSNLTCASPAVHGITANGFIFNGQKMDGFAAPVAAETFVEAAKRQGKKVISVGYASVDGQNERRSATWGISYPDAKYVAANQRLAIDVNGLPDASGWYFNNEVQEAQVAKESVLDLELNPVSKEIHRVNLLWVVAGNDYDLYVDGDKDLSNGYHAKLHVSGGALSDYGNVFAYETNEQSPLFGYRRRILLRGIIGGEGKVTLLVFGSSYNNAHPAAFREELEQAKLVWPNKNTYYGSSEPVKYAEEMAVIDNFLADVAVYTQKAHQADAVLFYQPLIDSVGHSFEGKLPRPFDPVQNTDEITKAYAKAYAIVDANLHKLLAPATAASTIALLGDHGMDAVKRMINAPALLDKADLAEVQLVASGTLVMLYPKEGSALATAKAFEVGAKLKEKLVAFAATSNGAVLGESYRKDTFAGVWQWGDAVWAYTGAPTVWLNVVASEPSVELTPYTWGMHGHAISHKDMATAFFLRGPHVKPAKVGVISLVQAMPSFAKSLGVEAPKQCEGTPLY